MGDSTYGTSSGYTSLPTSNLPGSVPAAAGADQVAVPFQGSNLQTFPPSDNRGKLLGVFQLLPDSEDSFGAQGNDNGVGSTGLFSVASYRQYFNVDTADVVQRIYDSCVPHRGDFVNKTCHNPDMYGPFWICTTLVFVAATLGNYASYLSSKGSVSWHYDISKVNWAAGVLYGYVCIVPLALCFLLQYMGVQWSIVQLWCLYGYSLFIFIPASVLSIVPSEAFRWVIVGVAGLMSATFLALNIRSHLESASDKWLTVVFGSFILQCCVALFLKIYFFSY
eukprot:c24985_g1_i2 orf=366-1202(-)